MAAEHDPPGICHGAYRLFLPSPATLLAPERLRGRIAMPMGGKTTSMTEIQSGRRVGAYEGAKAPGL